MARRVVCEVSRGGGDSKLGGGGGGRGVLSLERAVSHMKRDVLPQRWAFGLKKGLLCLKTGI